ncbi:hypothetical protein KSP40_PGU005571 [Platanthera guangdongensis]|uniref:Uncharacterized protein n=1 Tax=Platanthera guangdongensis TaxID=2320717 RepID=A0ABR2LJT2_9ASPA
MIHSKKRNKLDSKRLNDLVFVKFNALLKSKYSETSRDPLAAKNVDSGMVQEWMVNVDPEEDEDEDDDDEVFPGEGLTWAQIGNIVDADHDERRPQRLATSKEVAISYQRRGKRKISEVDEGDLEGSSDEDHILSTLPTIYEFSGDEK